MGKSYYSFMIIVSVAFGAFLLINWNRMGYGWTGYFALHWLLSLLLIIIWIVSLLKKEQKAPLWLISILSVITSLILDGIFLNVHLGK